MSYNAAERNICALTVIYGQWRICLINLYHMTFIITFKNLFTTSNHSVMKRFCRKGWGAGLSEPREWLIDWISVLGQSRWLISISIESIFIWIELTKANILIPNLRGLPPKQQHTERFTIPYPKIWHSLRISAHFKKYTRRSISPEYFCC